MPASKDALGETITKNFGTAVKKKSQSGLTLDEWMERSVEAMKEIYNNTALQKEISERQS